MNRDLDAPADCPRRGGAEEIRAAALVTTGREGNNTSSTRWTARRRGGIVGRPAVDHFDDESPAGA
ncbi:MAG: hypothetical protein AAGN46_17975, partial [Acidobacteriota bacterium]